MPDGTGDPLHGVIVLSALEAQQTHQMQAVRMVRIHRESLLTADLRIERPSGPHIREAGLIERGGRACDRTLGPSGIFGLPGGRGDSSAHFNLAK